MAGNESFEQGFGTFAKFVCNESKGKCTYTFLWSIENFSRSRVTEDSILSPIFLFDFDLECGWRLEIDPLGLKRENQFFCVRLVRIDDSSNPLLKPINCEITFMGEKLEPVMTATVRNLDFGDDKTFEFGIQRTIFDDNKSTYLPLDMLSLRCRIWKSIGNFKREGYCVARNVFPIERLSIEWPIKRFSSLTLNQKQTRTIGLVSVLHASPTLNFSLMGPSLSKAKLDFDIHTLNTYVPIIMICEITILDSAGNKALKCAEVEKKIQEPKVDLKLVLPQLITRKDLLKSPYLVEDTLKLLCEFTFLTGKYNGVIESYFYDAVKANVPRPNSPDVTILSCSNSQLGVDHPGISREENGSVSILQENLLSLWKVGSFSDFMLHSGDATYPVHKNILSVRSPVFRTMFSKMKKTASIFLDIPDVNEGTLKRMLTFLYTGTVDDLEWENALKLYYAAVKYQVESLKKECSSLLRSSINGRNATTLFMLAREHNDEELLSSVNDFICPRRR